MTSSWTFLDTLILAIYFIGLLLVGYYHSKRTETVDDFLVAGRGVGYIRLFGTVTSSDIGAGYVIGTAAAAYSSGYNAVWLVFSSLLGALAIVFILADKLKPLADKLKFVSTAHFLGYRYDKRARFIGSLMIIFANITFVGTQIVGGAAIISAVTGLPKTTAAWIAGTIVIIYTALGGLNSVIDTDVIQVSIIILGIFLIGVPLGLTKVGGFNGLRESLPTQFFSIGGTKGSIVLKWFISMVPSYMISMITWQRIFAAKDLKTVKKTYLTSGLVIWPVFAFFICTLGMIGAVMFPGINADLVFTTYIVKALPTGITGILVAAITATVMSTADSGLMSATATITNDIIKGFIKPDIEDKKLIRIGQILIIGIGLISMVVALYSPGILKLMLYAYQFNAAMFWPAMLGLFWPKANSNAAFWSLLIGGLGSVVWAVLGSPFDLAPIYIAFPLTLALMVIISLTTKHTEDENIIRAG